ncbi:MAG: hypothetical protein GY852_00775, partial [bacterium]|nr:hypothetical protein [bacterium]
MKWIFAFLVLAGVLFAGQLVTVRETTNDKSGPASGADDSECYAQYFQCLRDGCAAAQGNFNELTQGCYGGSDAKFAEAVGKCADAQGNCIMGLSEGTSPKPSSTSKEKPETPICPIGIALLALAGLYFTQT